MTDTQYSYKQNGVRGDGFTCVEDKLSPICSSQNFLRVNQSLGVTPELKSQRDEVEAPHRPLTNIFFDIMSPDRWNTSCTTAVISARKYMQLCRSLRSAIWRDYLRLTTNS